MSKITLTVRQNDGQEVATVIISTTPDIFDVLCKKMGQTYSSEYLLANNFR